MKFSIKTGLVGLTLCPVMTGADQNPDIQHNGNGCSIDWASQAGRHYLVQWSTDLENWMYSLNVRTGDGNQMSQGISCDAEKFFVRLRWSDIPITGNPGDADFDGDGVPTNFELNATPQSDPLDFLDTGGDSDGDGLKDLWETYFFGGLNGADPNARLQPDGFTNKEKSDLGLDPTKDYSPGSTALPQKLAFTYDPVGRLTSANGTGMTLTFTKDVEGNITNSQ